MSDAEQKAKRRRNRLGRDLRKLGRLVKLLRPHAEAHKRILLLGALLSAVLIALRLAQPWPLKWIIDSLSGSATAFSWVGSLTYQFTLLSLVYILLSVVGSLAAYWQELLLAGLGNNVLFSFRNQLFHHVLAQPLAFHERRDVGELLTRVVYDTSRLRRGVTGILVRMFLVLFMFLAVIVVLFWLNWRLAAVVGVCGGLALLTMRKSGRRILTAARRQRRREGQLAAVVAENIQGIRELQTFRVEHPADERFEGRNIKSLKQEQKVRRLAAGLLFRMETLLAVSITLILWLGASEVRSGELSLGDLVLFLHYTVGLYGPFRQFARQAAQSGQTMACADRLVRIMDRQPAVADLPGAIDAQPFRGDIVFENLSFKAPRRTRHGRKWILEDASFHIERGTRVAILGENGAGKSTLLRLLMRLSDPSQGRIQLDGHDLREYTLKSLRRQFSVVFQESVFFGLTVRENIAFGRPDATIEEIQTVAERCRIHEWVQRLKNGYETAVRRQGSLFSGGERQRIALARALLRNGQLWLLDEPTSNLDADSSDALTELVLDVTRGRTVLWITHDLRILPQFDRVLLLGKGRLRFFGTPKEFGESIEQDTMTSKAEIHLLKLKE